MPGFNPGSHPVQEHLNQDAILKKIASMGDELRNLPQGADLDGRFSLTNDTFFRCIELINTSADKDHISGLFGKGTTNKEENLYLLMTAVDSANITDETKALFLDILNAELKNSHGDQSYFYKVHELEKEIKSFALAENSLLMPRVRAVTLTIGRQRFTVEHTTGGNKDGVLANDCLAYSLRSNNSPLARDYRSKIFTPQNIENQLSRLITLYARNRDANSSDDTTTPLDVVKNQVRGNYDIAIPDHVSTVKQLSQVLAQHIQQTNCLLDGAIAGGIFAHELRQPIVVVGKDSTGRLVYNALSSRGELAFQGLDLNRSGIDLNTAKFIYNQSGYHFERMVPVASGST